MAPKKGNKNADVQVLGKALLRTQNKNKTSKQDQADADTESCSPTESDVPTLLRRSTRNLVNRNDIASTSSKQIKRKIEEENDCQPERKKVARNRSSRSKKLASKSESVKKKSVRRSRKKTVQDTEDSDVPLDSDDEICFINRLPVEVLTEIFTYLSFRDRKNTRLVCQRWFEANNVIQFSYDEKLLCYALYDFDVVIKTIENSQRKILNLEFYDMNFDNFARSCDFWTKCGPRIESLLFSDCILPDETMKQIILYCSQVKCLSLENMSNREENQKMCSDACLNELVNIGIRRESLYFLEMNINETGWISNNFLHALFSIYPNVKQFSFYCDTVEDDFNTGEVTDDVLLRSTEKCTFTSILRKLIDSQTELDSITLDVGDYQTLDFLPACQICTAISPLYFPELRDIKVDLELFGEQHTILEFFSRHRLLQSVECQIFVETSTADFIGQLMNCLLDSCPHLQSLQIVQDVYLNFGITLDASVFDRLRKSKLDSLSFNFGLEVAPSNHETINYNLRSLCILPPGVEKDMFLTLCKTFRGLTHLEILNLDDEGLQCIFQYLPSLTSLKLMDCQNCSDYGFTGIRPDEDNNDESNGYSISMLNKLQYLELKIGGDPIKMTEKTFAEFKFPDLSYFHITIETPWKLSKDLVKTLSNFSKMEGLACYFDDVIEYSVWLDLCSRLKKLRYLHVQFKEYKNFGDRNYKRIFECCPTLRALQHRSNTSSRSQSYYYDVVKRKIAKKKSEREYRVSSEQIDTFSVNWMWF